MTDREHRLRELVLRKLAKEIALVLSGIGSGYQLIRLFTGLGNDLLLHAVVASRHHVGPEFTGGLHEGVEFYFPVAKDIRIGGPSLGVFVEHVVDHSLAVRAAQVHEVEIDAYLPRHEFGHEPVLLPFAVPVQSGIGIMPILHEHGEDVIPLLLEEVRRHGGIDSTGESDTDSHKKKGTSDVKRKKGKLSTSHRYDLLPLLPSGPGGVWRELVVYDFPDCKCMHFLDSVQKYPKTRPEDSIPFWGHTFTYGNVAPTLSSRGK